MKINPHSPFELNLIAVEDNIEVANNIKQILEKTNNQCHVDVCLTKEEFLNKINSDYDAALLDLELTPDGQSKDGLEIADSLRHRNDEVASIPIIILTTHQENELLKEARSIGIEGFLTKPLSLNKCNMIFALLKCRHK